MWKPIYQPEPWLQYLNRKENIGVPLMEVRKKYMKEQLLFENYVSSVQQLNVLSPSSGASGGPSPSVASIPPQNVISLCFVKDNSSYTLVAVEGGDEHISSTYYMSYEGYSEWFQDRENAQVLAWDGSNWAIYYYSDVVAGIFVADVDYTNYLGDEFTSSGPEYVVIAGGTDPNNPIGTQFEDGYYIAANPCVAGEGKELEYDKYHIISLAYLPSTYPELVPDYIDPIGVYNEGYPTLYHTGSDFFASQSSEPYYRSQAVWVNFFGGSSYRAYLRVYGDVSSSFYSDLTQTLYASQSTSIVGSYNDGGGVPKARIEQGEIPNVVSYVDSYDGGKGTQTTYLNYIGKDSSGVAEYGIGTGINLRWDSSIWTLVDGVASGSSSTNIDNASGTYDLNGVIHTVAVHQTNANG